jgi:hypothetical protein
MKPGPTRYNTREQLYALCVLLCWPEGLTMSNNVADANTVNLVGVKGGNPGVSLYMLQQNPNATDVRRMDSIDLYSTVSFKVLGVELLVEFDEDGVGVVEFADEEDDRFLV